MFNNNLAPIQSQPGQAATEPLVVEDVPVMLLPRRDRSRDMGAHTECMCANDHDTQKLCTMYTKNSKRNCCRFVKFEFMCDYVKEMD